MDFNKKSQFKLKLQFEQTNKNYYVKFKERTKSHYVITKLKFINTHKNFFFFLNG